MRNNQIILGAGGAIGTLLAKELTSYTNTIYLFGRNPKKVNANDNLIQGDLLDEKQTELALENKDVAYLVAGLAYNTKVWEKDWPIIMKNIINGCKKHHVPLIFFDNIYSYDPDYFSNLTEETPIRPVSKKGKVRADLIALLQKEMEEKSINIQIVRSADFYGEGTNQSIFNQVVIEKILAGKKADWFIDIHKKHSFTLVSDAAKATALLGNTNSAYNQIWHLPTDNAYTIDELLQKIALYTDKPAKVRVTSKFMANLLGLFIPILKESTEMMYQFDRNYVFNSDKFQRNFNLKPTSMDDGIKQLILK